MNPIQWPPSAALQAQTCTKCHTIKPLSEFYRSPRKANGRSSWCKSCQAARARAYQQTPEGRAKIKAYQQTEKGKAALKAASKKQLESGYFRFGRGAIPILHQGAKKRGIPFSLEPDSFAAWWVNTPDTCFYCGIAITEYLALRDAIIAYTGASYAITKFKRFYRSPKHAAIRWMTVDRKNNEQGYVIENLVKSCWICNSLKNDFFTAEQMQALMPEVINTLRLELNQRRAP
jgi:hypothetical protein